MNIVAISCLGIDHRFVLEGVHRRFPLQGVIRPIAPKPTVRTGRTSRLANFVRRPLSSLGTRLNDWYFNAHCDRVEGFLTSQLGPEVNANAAANPWNMPILDVPRNELHGPAVREFLSDLHPDLIITTGCPILRPELFNVPRLGTVNIHWGIAPDYRGEHSVFWPLYFDDPDGLGVTIHRIDDSIDGGPMLAQGRPELSPNETEASAILKIARLTSELLPDVVSEIARTGRIEGTPPSGKGRLFRRNGRHWYHDLRLWWGRRTGSLRIPHRPERRTFLMKPSRPGLTSSNRAGDNPGSPVAEDQAADCAS